MTSGAIELVKLGCGEHSPLVAYDELSLRRMRMEDIPAIHALFSNELNFQGYESGFRKSLDEVAHLVERDIRRLDYTGYVIASGDLVLGRGAIGQGYFPKDDTIGAYQAAPIDETLDGKGPAEVQIGDFITADKKVLESIGLTKREAYEKTIWMLLALANEHISKGVLQGGQLVRRVIITVIDSSKQAISEEMGEDLLIKTHVIRKIFGEAVGFLSPKSIDPRNYSEHVRKVFSISSEDLPGKLEKHLLIEREKTF